MKFKGLPLLLVLTSLLFSCTKNTTNSTQSSDNSETSESEQQEPIDEELAELGEIKSGSFNLEHGIITSKRDVSLFLLKNNFDYGTFTFQLRVHSTFSDNGVLFHADKNEYPKNYYFFGFDILGKLSLTKYVDGHANILYKEKLDNLYTTKFVTLGAYFDEQNKKIEIFEHNNLLASIQDKEMLLVFKRQSTNGFDMRSHTE